MPFSIERNDLATMEVDAIVVPANERLAITGGAGAAVAKAAGFAQMQAACDELGFCATGSAVATPGFALTARWVIHAVGPVWNDNDVAGGRRTLRQTYDAALACAVEQGAASIALPLLSAGSFGFPSEVSFSAAMDAIRAFLDAHDDVDVHLALYDRTAVRAALALYGDLPSYIDDAYVREHRDFDRRTGFYAPDRNAPWKDMSSVYGSEAVAQGAPRASMPPAYGGGARSGSAPQANKSCAPNAGAPSANAGGPRTNAGMPSAKQAAPPSRTKRKRGALERLGDALSGLTERRKPEAKLPATSERSAKHSVTIEAEEAVSAPEPTALEDYEVSEKSVIFADKRADAGVGAGIGIGAEIGAGARIGAGTGAAAGAGTDDSLDGWLKALDTPFSTMLLTLIDARGLTDVEVYKRANMSRQLFSKIRSDASYRPTKKTVLALAIALRLDLDETDDLLRRAGFALSHSNMADVIIEYFIVHGVFDIFTINEALYAFDQPLL